MPAIFSKQASLALVALFVPFAAGQLSNSTLETLQWTSCEGGTALCGQIYFCALDAQSNWEYWNVPIDPMVPSVTYGSLWPSPQTIPAVPQATGIDGTPVPLCMVSDPNGSNGFLYAYRTATSACRPGKSPIIRVQPGNKYKLTLHNTADMNDPVNFPLVWTQLNALQVDNIMDPMDPLKKNRYPTHVTNLHIHGLHQSGQGDFDNVLKTLFPGNQLTYTYIIPSNHPGGMHWYHPHFHGKVVFQVFGGAFGPFIIDDSKSLLQNPPSTKATPVDSKVSNFLQDKVNERVLMAYSGFQLWMGNGIPSGATFPLTQNQWHRVRVMYVLPEGLVKWAEFMNFDAGLKDPATGAPLCQIRELAWDGTYASQVPFMGPPVDPLAPFRYAVHGAERVEYAIRCTGVGSFKLKYVDISIGAGTRGTVATFSVAAGSANSNTPFYKSAPWRAYRPPWLVDLQGATVAAVNANGLPEVKSIGDPATYGTTFDLTVSMDGLNGVKFTLAAPTATLKFGLDTIHQLQIFGSGAHPIHMHQQHYQIIGGNCGPAMRIGELYDTLSILHPDSGVDTYEPTSATYDRTQDGCIVRFRNVDFSGPQVIHCHVLDHEDIGIVGWFNVPPAPGAFELSSQFTNVAVPAPDCAPRLDAAGQLVCRSSAICGTTVGYDTCNQPCTTTRGTCPSGYYCGAGTCVSGKAKEAVCSMQGVSESSTSSSSSSGAVPWVITGVSLAVGFIAVIGAVCYAKRHSIQSSYATMLIEERKAMTPFAGMMAPAATAEVA